MAKTICVIDDCESIRLLLGSILGDEFNILMAKDGQEAMTFLTMHPVDAIILDLMLPDMSGYELCSLIKTDERWKKIPIVILSSKSGAQSRITAYQLGAMNYLEKPFEPKELQAIIKSIINRLESDTLRNIQIEDMEIDLLSQKVRISQETIALTSSEFRILCYLAQREGEVVSRNSLLRILGDEEGEVTDRVIDTHISSLRKKIKNSCLKIKAIYGEGYGINKA